jgi:hypothetical protein
MKKLVMVIAMIALVTSAAFGQLIFGLTGAQYYETVDGELPSIEDAFNQFRAGDNVFWGGFLEIVLKNLGFGFSFNAQVYPDPYGDTLYDMWNYDANVFLSYHLFGGKAFIDPFVQGGIGIMAYDFMNKEDLGYEIDYYNEYPLYASIYYDVGAGLGINIGSIGIFVKGMFNFMSDESLFEDYGDGYYEDLSWPILPFKWVFGAKLIL